MNDEAEPRLLVSDIKYTRVKSQTPMQCIYGEVIYTVDSDYTCIILDSDSSVAWER